MTDTIPEDALDTLPDGRTVVSMRKHALTQVAQRLGDYPRAGEECALLSARLDALAQDIQRRLVSLLTLCEEYERAETHLVEELTECTGNLARIPPFWTGENPEVTRARQGIERVRSQLGEELRSTRQAWLEQRAEAESELTEVWKDYRATREKVQMLTGVVTDAPTLRELLGFLREPPSTPIIVVPQPKVVAECVRLP
jgi:hypothetical protein